MSEDTRDADPTAMLVEGHPLLERGPLTATWRRWLLTDGRVRWTWRVEWVGIGPAPDVGSTT